MLHRLVHDFDDHVFPLFPLVHQPSVHEMLDTGAYTTDPVFLRRCLAMCAITVASAPNREKEVCTGQYTTYQTFVNRACDLVTMSRTATQPTWEDHPSFETAIDSVLLSLASHYAGHTRRGWSLTNEAALMIQDLQLHRSQGLSKLSPSDAERCKRMFWIIHMTQMYVFFRSQLVLKKSVDLFCRQDSFISPIPHMRVGFPPRNTDWEAMKLAQAADGEEQKDLAGFIHLTHLFSCVRDILSTEMYRPCLTTLAPNLPFLGLHGTTRKTGVSALTDDQQGLSFTDRLKIARQILDRLQSTANLAAMYGHPRNLSRGVALATATFHLTHLYVANAILDIIFASPPEEPGWEQPMFDEVDETVHGQGRAPGGAGDKSALWTMRGTLAQKLLHVLKETRPDILELNGFSLVGVLPRHKRVNTCSI